MLRRGLFLLFTFTLFGVAEPVRDIQRVDSIGITVSDLDRSIDFYSRVLQFEKVSETEVDGDTWEHLTGVFGLRMRVARAARVGSGL